MKVMSIAPFKATATVGLEKGYTREPIIPNSMVNFIQTYQRELIRKKGVYLSCAIQPCEVVLANQSESHLQLSFINYPKFPLKHELLKAEIQDLIKALMLEFNQNRVVIEYLDQIVMLEQSDKVDPKVSYQGGT